MGRNKAAVLAAATLVTAAATEVPWLRVPAGLLLVLALPGYALSALAVPSGPGRPPGFSPPLWRGIWTAGLSLAVSVLGGLLLNLTPAGLTRGTWMILLAGVTLAALAVAAWLGSPAAPASATAPGSATAPQEPAVPGAGPPGRTVFWYGLAALAVAGAATGLAAASAGWQSTPGFAQLWLVPGTGGEASLGVRSHYQATEAFHLVLRGGTRVLGDWIFFLTAGQAWQHTITGQGSQALTAQLTSSGGQAGAVQTVTGSTR